MKNTLAYHDKDKITAVKNFIEQALSGADSRTNVIKPFTAVFLNGPTKLERLFLAGLSITSFIKLFTAISYDFS